ncbi:MULTISPECIES: hypothetical protein [unclassified Providencia]|uniref:hypothetical protein n=1 Tax=unclassified Providencia TaxID=2633465 RepID=UPI00234A7EC4|nr:MULTISPECIES: hypothetical protein [unclassified Providencia]
MMYLYMFLYVVSNYVVVAAPMVAFLKTARLPYILIGAPISLFLIGYAKITLPKHFNYPFDDAFKYGLVALPIMFLIGKIIEIIKRK